MNNMTKEEFKNRATILAKTYQAHIVLNGKQYSAQGESEKEAIENLWEFLTSDLGIL